MSDNWYVILYSIWYIKTHTLVKICTACLYTSWRDIVKSLTTDGTDRITMETRHHDNRGRRGRGQTTPWLPNSLRSQASYAIIHKAQKVTMQKINPKALRNDNIVTAITSTGTCYRSRPCYTNILSTQIVLVYEILYYPDPIQTDT